MMFLASLFARIPSAKWIAACGAALFLGLMLGNLHATQRDMAQQREDLLTYAADRERAVGEAYAKASAEHAAKIKAAEEENARADKEAHDVYQAGIKASANAKATVERILAEERAKAATQAKNQTETINGLKAVNDVLAAEMRNSPAPSCILSERVRSALNAAISASNRAPGGDPEAQATGFPDGTYPGNSPLTCTDLAASMTDVLEHDAMLKAWVFSWQTWAAEALK